MKLIADQKISDYMQPGASFEIPDHDLASAHTLIEAGLAHEDTSAAPKADVDAPQDTGEPKEQAAATGRRYRRRDMTAEP